MEVKYLADYPQYINKVCDWAYGEWGHLYPESTRESRLEKLKESLNKDKVPIVFIAIDNNAVVGTASLIKNDMENHNNFNPWLATVYVDPDHRRRGIGSLLVKTIMDKSRDLHIKKLYLYTANTKKFYEQLGWKAIEKTSYRGEEVVIMTKKIQ